MSLQEDKWVRVMCDFAADGVWGKDGCAGSLKELPVSQRLRRLIRAWQDVFEHLNDSIREVQEDEVSAFSALGLTIAKAVKAELPDWTVVYFDEAKAGRGLPREEFEYEVSA